MYPVYTVDIFACLWSFATNNLCKNEGSADPNKKDRNTPPNVK